MSSLIDKKDLKVKHISGEYVNLPSSPEPEDIIYFMISKKKKSINKEDLTKFFGTEKDETINSSLEWLEQNNHIKIVIEEEQTPEKDENGQLTGEMDILKIQKFEMI